jgi:hypothetical protein
MLGLPASDASAGRIGSDVRSTLDEFYREARGGPEIASKAAGILVFPTVVRQESDLAGNMAMAPCLSAGGLPAATI